MKPLISVLIVEPSEIIVEGLRSILQHEGGYNLLAPLHDATNLDDRLTVLRPDMLIINPTLLAGSIKQQLFSLSQQYPMMPVVALVYQYIEPDLISNFKFAIDIRLSRSPLLSLLKSAAESVKDSPHQESADDYELSDRETDVLVLVAKGLSSKEIANQLNISVHTVNSHRKNITHKTGIKSVAGLAVYAMIHNLM